MLACHTAIIVHIYRFGNLRFWDLQASLSCSFSAGDQKQCWASRLVVGRSPRQKCAQLRWQNCFLSKSCTQSKCFLYKHFFLQTKSAFRALALWAANGHFSNPSTKKIVQCGNRENSGVNELCSPNKYIITMCKNTRQGSTTIWKRTTSWYLCCIWGDLMNFH